MAKVEEIKGTFVLTDGQEVQFHIAADMGWQQWGNRNEVLGSTVDLIEALAHASHGHLERED